VTHHAADHFEQSRLAVVSVAEKTKQRFFAHSPGQRIAEHSLNVCNQSSVPIENGLQKSKEQRACVVMVESNWAYLCDEVFPRMGSQLTCSEIDYAVLTIQQPLVLVEVGS